MSRLTSISIRSGSAILLAAIIVLIGGVVGALSLKQELLPSFDIPIVAVITPAPGSSVDDVERDVTRPIEDALQDLPAMSSMQSMTNEGASIVILQTDYGVDSDQVRADIRDRLGAVTLPDDASAPSVREISLDDFPILALSISGEQSAEELYAALQDDVVPQLDTVDGVSSVQLVGGGTSSAAVIPNAAALAQAGTTASAITQAVESATLVRPLGAIIAKGDPLPISVSERLDSLDDIRDVALLPSSGAAPGTTVGDVAKVQLVEVPADTRLRVDGEDAIGLNVTKLSTATTVEVVEAVTEELDDQLARLPGDVETVTIFDQAEPIKEAIGGIVREGALGILFAVLVILAFLRSWRSTFIAALSIPLSLAIALLVLWQQGFTLNVLTLGALTIAVGRVVDDSIVVIENIHRHIHEGDRPIEAAYTGTVEVLPAITASTLTTIAVFGPIALVGGIAQQLFAPFALTVVIALLASLVVAITVVPYFAARFMHMRKQVADKAAADASGERAAEVAEDADSVSGLVRIYRPILDWSLAHRWITVGIGVLILIASITPLFVVKQNLFDQSGAPVAEVVVSMPAGSSLDDTQAEVTDVAKILTGLDFIDQVTEQSGVAVDPFAEPGTVPANPSAGTITAVFASDVPSDVNDQIEDALDAYEGPADVGVGQGGDTTGAGSNSVTVTLASTDVDALTDAAAQVETAMQQQKGLTEVSSNTQGERSELRLSIDGAAATKQGVDPATLVNELATSVSGASLGTVSLDGKAVRVQLAPTGTGGLDQQAFLNQTVIATGGNPVRIGDVAKIDSVTTVSTINRTDGSRSATITAQITGDDLAAEQKKLDDAVDDIDLPSGVTIESGGAFEDLADTMNDLLVAMAAAVMLVYFVTVATFRSLLKPLILLMSIPLSLSGAFLGLLITGSSLSLPAMIGMLMLIGIVVTNAIVLLDLVERYREGGAEVDEALRLGASRRLRPVLMTALATMGALLPLALGLGGVEGGGGFISAPLAIVVIGGLFTSTLLTLVIVPALYSLTGRFTSPRQGREVREQLEAAAERRAV
jgi:HAE1 family hydrophobic/amphiphilic exporter-1